MATIQIRYGTLYECGDKLEKINQEWSRKEEYNRQRFDTNFSPSSSTYSYDSEGSKAEIWQEYLRCTWCLFLFWPVLGLILWAMGMEFTWVAAVVAISFALTGVVPSILLCIIQPPGFPPDTVIKSKKIRNRVSTIIVLIAFVGLWFCFNYAWNQGEIVWHIFPWV